MPGELGTHWVHLVEWGMYWLIIAGCGGDTLALQVVGDCIGLLCQVSWAHWAHLVGEGLYWLISARWKGTHWAHLIGGLWNEFMLHSG